MRKVTTITMMVNRVASWRSGQFTLRSSVRVPLK
jgi:hypothetical protein